MKKWERIIYQLKHSFMVAKVYKHYFGAVPFGVYFHDMDKIPYIIFTNKSREEIKAIHKKNQLHHMDLLSENWDNLSEKDQDRYVTEMICNWESARYTKPNKPKSASEVMIMRTMSRRIHPEMILEANKRLRSIRENIQEFPYKVIAHASK